jgi:hypothetical protein
MDSESTSTAERAHLEALRAQARAALLSRKKAEARGILGKLVTLSHQQTDQENLNELIKGVSQEVSRYVTTCGTVRERLLEGITMESIQSELDNRIPHWRAFANDIADLRAAREGLTAHEDPELKLSIEALEKKLAAGLVTEVIQEWNDLSAPVSVTKGNFVQILSVLEKLAEKINIKNWEGAEKTRAEALALLGVPEMSHYQQGCEKFLKTTGKTIRWETLLQKSAGPRPSSKSDLQNALGDLLAAKDELERLLFNDSSLKGIFERVNEAIAGMEQQNIVIPSNNGVVKKLVILLLIIIFILFAAWYYNSSMTAHVPPL